MNTIIQYKYITLVGQYLTGFKQVGNNLWNFRCPICGDSERKATKKRGYIYLKDNSYRFHCHNCGKDMALKNFLYNVSPELYKEYTAETLFGKLKQDDTETIQQECMKQSKCIKINQEKYLTNLTELPDDHPAIVYVRDVRRIPRIRWNRIHWTENFQELINEHFGDKYKNSNLPTTGIVFVVHAFASKVSGIENIPVIGYQLRSVDPNCPKSKRFVTCIESQKTGVYGIEHIDWSKQIFVTERPIDSLFIPNCIAVMTSALYRVKIDDAIYVNDCEPRNKEIVKQIERAINQGCRVTLLPEKYFSLDINDIVCKYNLSENDLVLLLKSNTYQGVGAKIHFSNWRLW